MIKAFIFGMKAGVAVIGAGVTILAAFAVVAIVSNAVDKLRKK